MTLQLRGSQGTINTVTPNKQHNRSEPLKATVQRILSFEQRIGDELSIFSIFSDRQLLAVFQKAINAGDFATICHCWKSAGSNIEMLESPAEFERLGNYMFNMISLL